MTLKSLLMHIKKPEETDVPILENWLKDPLFLSHVYGSPLDTRSQRRKKIYHYLNQNAKDTTNQLTLLTICNKTKAPIGLIQFNAINWLHRHTELTIAIGSSHYKHSFYGYDLYIISLLYAFFKLNLTKVIGYTHTSNTAAFNLLQTNNSLRGTLKSHLYRNGKFIDVHVHSCTTHNFYAFLTEKKDTLLKKHYKRNIFTPFPIHTLAKPPHTQP